MLLVNSDQVTHWLITSGIGLVSFMLFMGLGLSFLFWLIGAVFVPRKPQDEIVKNGLIIFDIDWGGKPSRYQQKMAKREARAERLPHKISS